MIPLVVNIRECIIFNRPIVSTFIMFKKIKKKNLFGLFLYVTNHWLTKLANWHTVTSN